VQVRRLRDSDLERAWELDRECFQAPEERRDEFLRTPPEELAGAFEGARLVALGRAIPLGQFFGGRRVAMGGVSSMATAPDRRGRGLAGRILRECLEIMRERGDALSALYPATTSLYRRHGWELAGSCVVRTLAPGALAALPEPRGVALRPGSLDEAGTLAGCYAELARRSDGFVDRSEARWGLLRRTWRGCRLYFAEDADGRARGYLVYRQIAGEHHSLGAPFRIQVEDHVALDRDALLALWRLLGSMASQVDRIVYRGTSEDPLLWLLPEQQHEALARVRWMTRVVDAARAVESRGFAPGLELEVGLALDDEVLEANRGPFVLRVSGGRGRLERGGGGALRLGAGAFASLYTGGAGAATLARVGLLEGGSERERADLGAAFAGPAPWMLDPF
jgi:predicted acetyltransferase